MAGSTGRHMRGDIALATQGTNDDFEGFVDADVELVRGKSETVGRLFDLLAAIRDIVGDRGSSRDAGAPAPGRFGNAFVDQFAIRPSDRVCRNVEFESERSYGRQSFTGDQASGCDMQCHLRPDLFERRNRGAVVEPDAHRRSLPICSNVLLHN